MTISTEEKCPNERKSDSLKRVARFLWVIFFEMKSEKNELRRREYILNTIIWGSIALFSMFTLFVFYNFFTMDEYRGIPPVFALVILGIFLFLYFLSRIGRIVSAAYLLVFIYFSFITYGVFVWGVDLPQCLLTYAVLIVIAGIILGKTFSLRLTLLIIVTINLIGYLQVNGLIEVHSYWKVGVLSIGDVIEYSITLGIITLVSWLSNGEIEKSLMRARNSEAELKKERDMLEDKVKERTEELQRIQYEKNRQVFKMAEFGRLSSGLFHDLSNYLTVLFLSVERAETGEHASFSETKNEIKKVNLSLDKTREFLSSMQRQMQMENKLTLFSLVKEIESVIDMLSYELKKKGVNTSFKYDKKGDFLILGDLAKFNQIIINLLINAIDAYESMETNEKIIEVEIRRLDDFFEVIVRDFGEGIDNCIIGSIFDPFFTTKKDKGTGVGLTTARELARENFLGDISVRNNEVCGVEFKIKIKQRVADESEK